MKKENLIHNIIIVFIIMYLNAVMTNGILGPVFDIFSIYPLILLLLAFIYLSIKKAGLRFYFTKQNYLIGLFVILTAIPYFVKNDVYLYFITCQLLAFGIMHNIYRFCKKYNTSKENKVIAYIVLVNYLLTYIASILYLGIDSTIIRTTGHESKTTIKQWYHLKTTFMLGTIGTAYGSLIVALMSISRIIKKDYKWTITLFICLLFFIKSDLLIGLLSFTAALLLYVFLMIKKKIGIKKSALVFVALALLFVFGMAYVNKIGMLPTSMAERVDDILNVVKGNMLDFDSLYNHSKLWVTGQVRKGDITDLEARIITYLAPIIGIIENRFMYNPFNVLISSHTTVLDFLSLYGFLSIGIFFWFYKTLGELSRDVDDKEMFISIAVYFFISCVLNANLQIDNAILIYFVVPTICQINKPSENDII